MAHSSEHYLETAASLRRLAESLPVGHLKDELAQLAADYELLAERVQQRDANVTEIPHAPRPKSST